MQQVITLNGRTFKYTSSAVYLQGKLVYSGAVNYAVLKAIAYGLI